MSKVMGILSNVGLFHQIWSCHVTQEANFENFLFCPNSTFNIRKVTKFLVEKLYFRSYQAKTSRGGGVENTLPRHPVPLGLNKQSISFLSQLM